MNDADTQWVHFWTAVSTLRNQIGAHPLHPDTYPKHREVMLTELHERYGWSSSAGKWVDVAARYIKDVCDSDDLVVSQLNQHEFVVQHVSSGLRAQFSYNEDGIGAIASKPYEIDDISGGRSPAAHTWFIYSGLGIGQQVYRLGAHERPTIRWGASAVTSPEATRVRERLHAIDPYTWGWRYCPLCPDKDTWKAADRATVHAWH